MAQPGTYTAQINIGEDTPYDVDPVGVTMNITSPGSWGTLTGTVSGLACDGTTAPLEEAVVHVHGPRFEVTLITAADGTYAYWIGARRTTRCR